MTRPKGKSERVVVIGRGRAGGSLAASLRRARVPVRVVSGRAPPRTLTATVVLVAVPDRYVGDVHVGVDDGCVVAHVAGALSLSSVRAQRRGAFHPLASLDGKTAVPRGCLCAIDADVDDDLARLTRLAERIGLVPRRVTDADRVAYHAGAVVAGNLATALLAQGIALLRQVGVDDDVARVSLARLLASTAARAEALPLAQALTGPVARGDAATVAAHLDALDARGAGDVTAAVYRALTGVLVDDVADLDPAARAGLRSALVRR